ncbi:site-specific integrase [Clostridium sp. SHJSY1]|uniref:site-specific integrase n=1 Tax=Clostridium sp. SHJSY1 TaxID=2942483 RepID=UPI0028745543|nr:site-specific integrase [Clostridium sp. SHJSY1]
MKLVQPIRDRKKIQEMQNQLLKKGMREYMLFTIGITCGLRISDILVLKVADVRNKSYISLLEKKTRKPKRSELHPELQKDIQKYTQYMKDEEYLFQSRKGNNKPITRVQAYRILNGTASKIGLEEIGTHTLRKTFGFWHYQLYKDVAILQEIFNHSSPSITLRYIGVTDDMKNETIVGVGNFFYQMD